MLQLLSARLITEFAAPQPVNCYITSQTKQTALGIRLSARQGFTKARERSTVDHCRSWNLEVLMSGP